MRFSSMPNDQVCHCQEGGIRQSVDHRSRRSFPQWRAHDTGAEVQRPLACNYALAEALVSVIDKTAQTGLRGDGKIYAPEVSKTYKRARGEILISELQPRSTEIWRYAMKGSAAIFLSAGLLFLMLAGCRTAAKEIQMKSHSEKTDVFREVKAGEAVPKGFVDMTIKASIKTHTEGQYPLEPKEQFHGNPDYPFLINIDGQAAIWKVNGSTDDTPLYDERGNRRTDPEAGTGVKYILDKKIKIAAGPHRIFFGLTAESVTKKIEVTLKDGEIYVLQLKPVYEYTIHPYRIPSFLEGVKDYEVFLNGVLVQ